jgi:hypothetical protein
MNLLSLLAAAITTLSDGTRVGPVPDSVVHDSIYSLAVNPADYPKDAFLFLLDEGVYRIEPDGKWSRTLRQVVQILKPQGAMQYREQQFSYEPDREKLTINWMRVVKPNGEVISAAPEQTQESDVPAEMWVPTYTSTKVKRLSLTGLDSGTVLDYSFTVEEFSPAMAGDFYHSWRINPPVPVRRSLLVLDVPQSFAPRIIEKNLNFRRTERAANGRRIYIWATSDVTRARREIFAPDSAVKDMAVNVSAPIGWSAIGNWYASLVAPRYAVGPVVAAKIKSLVSGAKTRSDSIAAIQKWVSTDVRYVAIELGRGGYEPRDAETVSRTGFGDCKDKTMLFLAALRSIGINGYPVLLNAFGTVDEASPSVASFNHVIAAVETNAGLRYSDLTVPDSRFGLLPNGEHGKFGVLVKGGASEPIHLPGDSAKVRNQSVSVSGRLGADGIFNGVIEERISAADEDGFFRSMLTHPPDSASRAGIARSLANALFDGADGDSLKFIWAPDTSSVIIRVKVNSARSTSEISGLVLFMNPIHPFATPGRIISLLVKEPRRTQPFDLGQISAGVTSHDEAVITLPDGWHAMLPGNVNYSGFLGTLQLSFSQTGNELRISRTSTGVKGAVGPDKLPDILAALKLMMTDNTRTIPIQKQ